VLAEWKQKFLREWTQQEISGTADHLDLGIQITQARLRPLLMQVHRACFWEEISQKIKKCSFSFPHTNDNRLSSCFFGIWTSGLVF